MNSFFDNFSVAREKEDYSLVTEQIEAGVEFKGTNLWILVFAIFIASLGLNVNSTAVIIGAMLISPLMGPIVGIGLGVATNDFVLLRKAAANYTFAAVVGIVTSAIYFLLTPIKEASSEIIARTSPNTYDLLIALFGGFAGVLALCSKQKGNVIPGVAIATALMPPICAAGYGLATNRLDYFMGAFYLFFINTVFIAIATYITLRYLNFPYKAYVDKAKFNQSRILIVMVALLTALPSVYLGIRLVRQNTFIRQAQEFINEKAKIDNTFLIDKTIDVSANSIKLVFGGEYLDENTINNLKQKANTYGIDTSKMVVQQGYSYLQLNKELDSKEQKYKVALAEKDYKIIALNSTLDSIKSRLQTYSAVNKELKILYPQIKSVTIGSAVKYDETKSGASTLCYIDAAKPMPSLEYTKIKDWLIMRCGDSLITVVVK